MNIILEKNSGINSESFVIPNLFFIYQFRICYSQLTNNSKKKIKYLLKIGQMDMHYVCFDILTQTY